MVADKPRKQWTATITGMNERPDNVCVSGNNKRKSLAICNNKMSLDHISKTDGQRYMKRFTNKIVAYDTAGVSAARFLLPNLFMTDAHVCLAEVVIFMSFYVLGLLHIQYDC